MSATELKPLRASGHGSNALLALKWKEHSSMHVNGDGRQRLKVAHVTQSLDMGGLEKLLVEFAKHGNRDLYELHFVCLGAEGLLGNEIESLGWQVHALDSAQGFHPGLVLRLARLFRRLGIGVVHTHDDRPLIYAAVAGKLARVRQIIHTQHGRNAPLLERSPLLCLAATLVDHFVCVSENLTQVTSRLGIARGRVRRIWNGIDIDRFDYAGPQSGGPLVMIARVNPEKDAETLLRALPLVLARKPDIQLKIAGDGPSLPNLRKLAGELDISNHVDFLGQVQDIPVLLRQAGAFVLPSLSEGISLTILEAMARGLPVVSTPVGGTPELVIEGETGLLVPCRDPQALSEAILRLQNNPEEARRMGQSGRHRATTYFDIRRMVADYESLYAPANSSVRRVSPRAVLQAAATSWN